MWVLWNYWLFVAAMLGNITNFGNAQIIDDSWKSVLTLPTPPPSGNFESPVIVSSGVNHVLVMYSDQVDLFASLSIDGGKTFPEFREVDNTASFPYSVNVAAGTTSSSLGTFQACWINGGSQKLRTAEYRGGIWYAYENVPAMSSVPEADFPAGCAVSEGSSGTVWNMLVMYHVHDAIYYSRIVAYSTRRTKSNTGTTTWDTYVKLDDVTTFAPDFDKNFLGDYQILQPKLRCMVDGHCDFRYTVYNEVSKIGVNMDVAGYDFRDINSGIQVQPPGQSLGVAIVQATDRIGSFYMAYDTSANGFRLKCTYSYYEKYSSGVYDYFKSYACPDLFYPGPDNAGNEWFFSLDAIRHYDQGCTMLSISAMRVASNTGQILLRDTAIFESSNDFVSWGPKQTPFANMTHTSKWVTTSVTIARDGWLVGIASGNQGKIMRKGHTLGNYKITSQADFTNSPTVMPTGQPTTLNPTVPPTVATQAPTRNPQAPTSVPSLPTTSIPTSQGAASPLSDQLSAAAANAIIAPGAAAGFIAAVAFANAAAFILRFGDDMRYFTPASSPK
jgi:hypothetical protein